MPSNKTSFGELLLYASKGLGGSRRLKEEVVNRRLLFGAVGSAIGGTIVEEVLLLAGDVLRDRLLAPPASGVIGLPPNWGIDKMNLYSGFSYTRYYNDENKRWLWRCWRCCEEVV